MFCTPLHQKDAQQVAWPNSALLFFNSRLSNDHGTSRATPDDEISPPPDRSPTPTLSHREREMWSALRETFIVT
jgi:hypothetical protein